MKRQSSYTREIPFGNKKVWDVVVNSADTNWRSDLTKTEVLSENKFKEYFKNGGETIFTITEKTPYTRYHFNMKNQFFDGSWCGTFEMISEQKTRIVFKEKLNIKNPVIWCASFFRMNLKTMQKQYVDDLEMYLKEIEMKERINNGGRND